MLMNNYVEAIKGGTDIRKTLIALREEIKDDKQKRALAYLLAGDFSVFTDLLQNSDAKVRKNVVLLLGEMECDELSGLIWEAYQKEKTLFVKGDYIKALAKLDCSPYLKEMKNRLQQLNDLTPLPEEEKHFRNESVQLKSVIMKYEKPVKHKFIAYEESHEIILMVNRNQREATASQIEEPIKMLAGGIRFTTNRLKDILQIRTYSEMLFPISKTAVLEGSPERMAEQLIRSGIVDFLDRCHEGKRPFYFRLELKCTMMQEQKIDLVKKLSAALERCSGGYLLNATSGYEVELRLVAGKDGRFVPLLKLFTVPDWRFAYRREYLPTSIQPVNAALIMELTGEYLQEYAQVLDPFCGTGTMLIERHKKTPARNLYGIDILEEAVEKARSNTEQAHMLANYINRDFFDFRHEYLFDEVVTNLPVCGKTRDRDEIINLYNRFLNKLPEVIRNGAIVIAYCSGHELFLQCLRNRREYRLVKQYCLNERDQSFVHVLKFQS